MKFFDFLKPKKGNVEQKETLDKKPENEQVADLSDEGSQVEGGNDNVENLETRDEKESQEPELEIKNEGETLEDLKNEEAEKTEEEIERIREDIDSNKDKKEALFSSETMAIFSKFNISEEDLNSIPSFSDLNDVSKLLLAKTFYSNSLERAKGKSTQEVQKMITSKNKFARKFQSIYVGLFKSSAIDRASEKEEKEGGIAKHLEELQELSLFYRQVNFVEKEKEEGSEKEEELKIDFFKEENIDLEYLTPEGQEWARGIITEFNETALKFSQIPKHWQNKYASEENLMEYKRISSKYKKAKEELTSILSEVQASSKSSQALLHADYQVNVMQFLTANPELEKEWSMMSMGFLKKMATNLSKSQNLNFFFGGMIARSFITSAVGTVAIPATAAVTSAVGTVAIPATAAVIGALRGYAGGKKEIRRKEEIRSKDLNIKDSKIFTDKEKVFQEMTEMTREYDIEEKINYLISQPAFIEKAKELTSSQDGEEFIFSRNVDDVLDVYNQLDDKDKVLEAEDYELLKNYSLKISDLKRLNTEINKIKGESLEINAERSIDLTEKINKLLAKLEKIEADGINSEDDKKEYQETIDMLNRRLEFSYDKEKRDLVNFGKMKERALNQAEFYQALSAAKMFLITSDIGLSDAYDQMEDRAYKILEMIEESQGQKISENRKKFFIKKTVEGALTGAIFASAGAAVTSSVRALYEGVGDMVVDHENIIAQSVIVEEALLTPPTPEDIINSQAEELGQVIDLDRPLTPDEISDIKEINLPDDLHIDEDVLEIAGNDDFPFKEEVLNNENLLSVYDKLKELDPTVLESVVKAGELTEQHLDISSLVAEHNLSPEEITALIGMENASYEELIEEIGNLRSLSDVIDSGGNFTNSLRNIMAEASESTQDAFIKKVEEMFDILKDNEVITSENRQELLNRAINRLSVEGDNPDSGVANYVYKGNVLKVNSETGQWEIQQGDSSFAPKARGFNLEKISTPDTIEEVPVPEGKIPDENLFTEDTVSDNLEEAGADNISPKKEINADETEIPKEQLTNLEDEDDLGSEETLQDNGLEEEAGTDNNSLEEGISDGQTEQATEEIPNEQPTNLENEDDLDSEEEGEIVRERTSSVTETEKNILKSNSHNLSKTIHGLAGKISDPERIFTFDGKKTSLKEMLNGVTKIDNFYDKLSAPERINLNECISDIQRSSRLNPIAESKFTQFMEQMVEKYK